VKMTLTAAHKICNFLASRPFLKKRFFLKNR
jgi:hypothetical protein